MDGGEVVGHYDRIVLLTDDPAFGEAITSMCARRGIRVASSGTGRAGAGIVVLDLAHFGATSAAPPALPRDGVKRVIAIGDLARGAGGTDIDAWVSLDARCEELLVAITGGRSGEPVPKPAGGQRGTSETEPGAGEANQHIVFAEPHRLLRDALAEALHHEYGFEVTATDGDVAATVLQAQRVRPSVVVAAPSRDLTDLCERLNALEDSPPTLVLDRDGSEDLLLQAIESGAAGYVTGHGGLEALAEAVHAIANGESVVPPAMLGPLLRRLIQRQREASSAMERLVVLTPREREVLALLADGRDAAGIAAVLFISPETARTHLQRVLRKLGVHSRREAVALVATSGLAERLGRMVERNAS